MPSTLRVVKSLTVIFAFAAFVLLRLWINKAHQVQEAGDKWIGEPTPTSQDWTGSLLALRLAYASMLFPILWIPTKVYRVFAPESAKLAVVP